VKDSDVKFTIFTTRADTIFGVTFMVLAPESECQLVTTERQKAEVDKYLDMNEEAHGARAHADRKCDGCVLRLLCHQPASRAMPFRIWISAIMYWPDMEQAPSWPCLLTTAATMLLPNTSIFPIIPLIEGCDVSEESFDAKEGIVMNSPK
jgi:leucyl-tRNA synthetase